MSIEHIIQYLDQPEEFLMKRELKVLLLEDEKDDVRLIERALRIAGLNVQAMIVDTKDEFVNALHQHDMDVILSDHALPQFNSTEALKLSRAVKDHIPFIIVTGNVSEEFAVASIKAGADDYILKSHLEKLPAAILQALSKKELEMTRAGLLQQLKDQNRSLTKYHSELESFVQQVSQTLREPLVSVLNVINSIKEHEKDADQIYLSYFDMMELSITKLDRTLQELTGYLKKDNAETQPRIDLRQLIEDQLERMNFMPGSHRIRKEVRVIEQAGLFADHYHLSVIINNLVSNAIKYADHQKDDSYIDILSLIDGEKAVMIIKDNGIGIDEKYFARIFDMFFRATGERDGIGLGLYIVKESVDKLGGKIEISSKLGAGTSFTVTIPNRQPLQTQIAQQRMEALH